MKLRISENNILQEDIAAVKKYYPNIPDDTFMQLIQLDPTYRDGSNSVGKYGKWILNLYKKGTISEEDFSEITPLLSQFTTYKNRVANKDLNSYKTLDDLSNTLAQVVDDDSMLSDRQKLRFRKNVKAGRVSTSAEDDYDIVFEDGKYIVYVPNTHEASMKLGKGTSWCTAHENRNWYDSYTRNGGKLYIIKNKQDGERWQYSDSTGDFLDETDSEFDIIALFDTDKKLSKFMCSIMGIDITDGNYTYSGGKIDKKLKPFIKYVTVADEVSIITERAFSSCKNLMSVTFPNTLRRIDDYAFFYCEKLASVEFPEGLVSIGKHAFSHCYNLKHVDLPKRLALIEECAFQTCSRLESVVIPENIESIMLGTFDSCENLKSVEIRDGVEFIMDEAFSWCSNLTSVTIPDSVTRIGDEAFTECISLESLIIPDSVTNIGDMAFFDCDNLTIYTENEYVKAYCDDFEIKCEPIAVKKESVSVSKRKLKISEDTACVASKTSYGDTGLDDNGIYYFGKKPKKPVNWKDIKKDDVRKYRMDEMVKNGIFIPRCPKRALSRKSIVTMPYISLRSPDSNVGTDVTILGSKNEAKQFIVDHLYNKQFPMAASEMTIQTYNEHPEYYEDDMEEFYYNMTWLDDNEGEALFVESDGKAHVFDGMYADAIEALKLRNITELIYSDAYEYVVYNAYIVYDDSIEGWRDSVDATDYLDGSFDDYRWKNIKGTYIQIPDWADSWRDVVM